jgi:hypothetical protein
MSDGEYEFSDAQNKVFDSLASSMRLAGWSWIFFAVACGGALVATGVVIEEGHRNLAVLVGNGIGIALILLMGIWCITAARPVSKIVTTKGNDITNLMEAMQQLQRVYSTQRIAVIIAAVAIGMSLALDKLEHVF